MKKIALIVLIILAVVLCTGCASTKVEGEPNNESTFVIIEETPTWRVVYDRTTGVMYTVSYGTYSKGVFSPILNADGSLKLYGGR